MSVGPDAVPVPAGGLVHHVVHRFPHFIASATFREV
jgi:hypothetical protein